MPRRKPVITDRRVRGLAQRRIRLPQPAERPIRLLQRKSIKREKYQENAWWFIEHREGVHRPLVGEDPLEARAVQNIKGSLPERIVYRWITSKLPGITFDFHSSLEGGRIELGGIDIDFLFPDLKMAIEVQGPTHSGYLRMRKDDEKKLILADYGYGTVYAVDDDEIYSQDRFEDRMRRIFFIRPGYNGFAYGGDPYGDEHLDPAVLQSIYDSLVRSDIMLDGYLAGGL